MKTIFVVVGLVCSVGAAYFGYQYYTESQIVQLTYPAVKNASLRVTNALHYEIAGGNITYKELFDKLESDIAEIDKKILEVQMITTDRTKKKTDGVLSYLRTSQELLRAELSKHRKQLSWSSSMEWANKAMDMYKDAVYSGRDYSKKTMDDAFKQMKKESAEFQSAVSGMAATARKLIDERTAISQFIPYENLINVEVLNKVVTINSEKKEASDKKE